MKFSVKDFCSRCEKIRSFLRIWSHLLKKSSMENFTFCTVISIYIDVLFTSSPCMTFWIPKNSHILKSVFSDAFCVLIWIFSAQDESSVSGAVSVSMSVGNFSLKAHSQVWENFWALILFFSRYLKFFLTFWSCKKTTWLDKSS